CRCCMFVFFQAEDGIRDWSVTGVQTCALPISHERGRGLQPWDVSGRVMYRWNANSTRIVYPRDTNGDENWQLFGVDVRTGEEKRSEERRVGKEGRARGGRWRVEEERRE